MGIWYREIICAAAGILTGWFLPSIISAVMEYKQKQKGEKLPELPGSQPAYLRGEILLFMTLISLLAGALISDGKSLYLIIFTAIALVVVMIDYYIRIIPNECVLVLSAAGISYRLFSDGWKALPNVLAGFALITLFFGGTAALFFLLRKKSGIGAGDIKLAMAISLAVGYDGIIYFLTGMALAVVGYVLWLALHWKLDLQHYFPMSAHLCIGFMIALFAPYFAGAGLTL